MHLSVARESFSLVPHSNNSHDYFSAPHNPIMVTLISPPTPRPRPPRPIKHIGAGASPLPTHPQRAAAPPATTPRSSTSFIFWAGRWIPTFSARRRPLHRPSGDGGRPSTFPQRLLAPWPAVVQITGEVRSARGCLADGRMVPDLAPGGSPVAVRRESATSGMRHGRPLA